MDPIIKKLGDFGLVPVIKIDRAEDVVPLAKALCEGGLPVAEVTFRTAAAKKAIAAMAKAFPQMVVGAGTVLNAGQVDDALEAGAQFIVSPGLNPETVRYCQQKGVPILPGCATPSDMERAIALGLEVVKFFPAEAVGGLAAIKAMAAPYGSLKFMPTGGINSKNLASYLAFPKILACGGSFMVDDKLVKAGDFDGIRELTRKAVQAMLGYRFDHVGVNCAGPDEMEKGAKRLEALFGLGKEILPGSIFSGYGIELLKNPGVGVHGHIAIHVHNIARAVAYLKAVGVELPKDGARYDEQGNLTAMYLGEEVCGFALHLTDRAPAEKG